MAQHNHYGHRQRLKDRFLQTGFTGFDAHGILELLLFYSIPQRDTNDLAHELVNRFGSLSGVFDASYEDLVKVSWPTRISMIGMTRESFSIPQKKRAHS